MPLSGSDLCGGTFSLHWVSAECQRDRTCLGRASPSVGLNQSAADGPECAELKGVIRIATSSVALVEDRCKNSGERLFFRTKGERTCRFPQLYRGEPLFKFITNRARRYSPGPVTYMDLRARRLAFVVVAPCTLTTSGDVKSAQGSKTRLSSIGKCRKWLVLLRRGPV